VSSCGLTDLTKSELFLGIVLIVANILGTLLAAFLITQLFREGLGINLQFNLGYIGRGLGYLLIAAGLVLLGWTFRTRRPRDLFNSTAIMANAFFRRRTPKESKVQRTEPFVVSGPYRIVRHPMYLSIILTIFGVGLLRSAPVFIIWGAILVIWFWAVYIPFEERDLQTLFGDDYQKYKKRVPRLFPNGKRY
jgi:protein-S-isoprenylcysteine O-methyltransferase Ste14